MGIALRSGSGRRCRARLAKIAIGLLAVLAAGGPTSAQQPVSFADHIQPLLNNHCVFCHMTGAEAAGLNLEPEIAYGELVGVPSEQSSLHRVEPGEPAKSYLVHKLEGTHLDVGGAGARMPLRAMRLSEDQLQLIRQWIEEGAQNN